MSVIFFYRIVISQTLFLLKMSHVFESQAKVLIIVIIKQGINTTAKTQFQVLRGRISVSSLAQI